MSRRIPILIGLFASILVTANALATPGSGVTGVAHVSRATLVNEVHVNSDRVKFETSEPTDVSVVTLTMPPGATTGWHAHPGVALIAVTEGTGVLHGSDCSVRTYQAGDVFVEAGGDPANVFRNESTSPVVLTVTFVAPKGRDFRISAPNPGCSAG
jgi:quercetin dioxygenase-like cupin family protein